MAPATALSLESLCLVFGLCCLLPLFLRAELVLVVSSVLALWCGLSLEGSVLRCPLFWLKLSFLELTVLPRAATVLPQKGWRYFRTQRGSNFLLPPGRAVLPLRCGTSARAVLPR